MTANRQRTVVLVEDGYQELEFWYPLLRLREEGYPVDVAGLDGDRTYRSHLGYPVIPDLGLRDVPPETVAGVIVPGGLAGAAIAGTPEMVAFVHAAAEAGAAIGVLSEAERVLAAADLPPARGIAAADADALPDFVRRFLAALPAAEQ